MLIVNKDLEGVSAIPVRSNQQNKNQMPTYTERFYSPKLANKRFKMLRLCQVHDAREVTVENVVRIVVKDVIAA